MSRVDTKTAADLLLARMTDLAGDFYLRPADLARRWHVSAEYLAVLRAKKRGPEFTKLNHGSVLYRASVILKYEADGYVQTVPHFIGNRKK